MTQQQRPPASVRAMVATVEVIVEDAVERTLNGLRAKHVAWHEAEDTQPEGSCHACVLLQLAKEPSAPKAEDT